SHGPGAEPRRFRPLAQHASGGAGAVGGHDDAGPGGGVTALGARTRVLAARCGQNLRSRPGKVSYGQGGIRRQTVEETAQGGWTHEVLEAVHGGAQVEAAGQLGRGDQVREEVTAEAATPGSRVRSRITRSWAGRCRLAALWGWEGCFLWPIKRR